MRMHIHERTYINQCIHARICKICKNTFTMPYYAILCPSPVILLASLCYTCSCYLLCCVLVGVCLAAASWHSKIGLLVTLPPSQPVAGLPLHHLQLLPVPAQLCCLMVKMRLAAASWQSITACCATLVQSCQF